MRKKVTYEDFEEFVRNRPQPDTPGFYKLWRLQSDAIGYERHEVKGISLNKEEPFKGYIWRFPVKPFNEIDFEYYPTFEEAYAAMMERDGIEDCPPHVFPTPASTIGYLISRLGFGPLSTNDFYVQYWLYDAARREFDHSSCSSFHWGEPGVYGKYLGRLPEEIPFKEGDIVEITVSRFEDNDKWYSTLGIVIGVPRSVREVWDYLKGEINEHVRNGNPLWSYFYFPDNEGTDGEEYFILAGPYDESERYMTFRHPIEVRPPSFPVPDEAKDTLRKYYDDYLANINNEYIHKKD